MNKIIQKIEDGFEAYGHFLYQHRYIAVLIIVLLSAVMVFQLPKLRVDTSIEGFLDEEDPIRITYNAFREQFGRDDRLIIAIKPNDVFNMKFLSKLKALHEDMENNVPFLNDITSLINARSTRGMRDELIVEELMEKWPRNNADLIEVKKRVLSNPIYRNMLISEDGRFTTIILQVDAFYSSDDETDELLGFEDQEGKRRLLTDRENSIIVEAVNDVIERHKGEDFLIYFAGSPVVMDNLKKGMMRDIRRFMGVVILLVCILLFFLFRRVSGVILPLFVVLLSLFSTLGLMAFFEIPIHLPTQILPSFLLAVGVGDSVHILTIFYRRLKEGDAKEEAVCFSLAHAGMPIVMTSVTTAGALLSFSTAQIEPISALGIFSSIGVILALLFSIILLPALLSIIPFGKGRDSNILQAFLDRILIKSGDFATMHPWRIVLVSMVLIAFSFIGISRLWFTHYPLYWLPDNSHIRRSTEAIDRELKGSVFLEVVINTGVENGLYSPDILNKLEDLGESTQRLRYEENNLFVGKTMSVVDILKEIHQALNEERPEFYAIPQKGDLIAQEFLLFENSGSDDLEDFVDSQFSKARFSVKLPFLDSMAYKDFFDELEGRFRQVLGNKIDVTLTGIGAILMRTFNAVIVSMAMSYLIAGIVITFLMILLIADFRMGIVSMIPNLMPVVIILGIMGWLNLPLDIFTMLIGSIAIGLAVDDTIHFMHNFRRYYKRSGDAKFAVRETLQIAGRAMLFTSLVLSGGFFIYLLSSMNNLFNFGLLTGLTILLAFLSDVLLAPALMTLVTRFWPKL
ncbi:MAG: MMPL family transporter [Spirochaetota bacterium]|nr:MMPL family transporter [Spirochaetota bacterium]